MGDVCPTCGNAWAIGCRQPWRVGAVVGWDMRSNCAWFVWYHAERARLMESGDG